MGGGERDERGCMFVLQKAGGGGVKEKGGKEGRVGEGERMHVCARESKGEGGGEKKGGKERRRGGGWRDERGCMFVQEKAKGGG